MTVFIDYSIGPVQGFVAQSRRTRDLWGSSYLLSALSGHAMLGAIKAGGEITRPSVQTDPLFGWISGKRVGSAPTVGSLPNRFQVRVKDDTCVSMVVNGAAKAFGAAWDRVHRTVLTRFVSGIVPYGRGTEDIWNRQTSSFWEISWTASPSQNNNTLVRRKLWRTHRYADEPGDKCTVMHDFQELSGYIRSASPHEASRQDEFWDELRCSLRTPHLRDDERLCSLALVKRLFPLVAREALGWDVDTSHWPSTVYVAAVPWIREVLTQSPSAGAQYASVVREASTAMAFTEECTPFRGLSSDAANRFALLDANYFHKTYIRNQKVCLRSPQARLDLLEALDYLRQTKRSDGTPIGNASSYYALLLADGDRVGNLLTTIGSDEVGKALSDFSKSVPSIVEQHDGVTVYSGGDDVLAMLPVPKALGCAERLSSEYAEAFGHTLEATLSASIVFANIRLPLSSVIAEARRLLDDCAKEDNGRDSLAVAVRNRGGSICEWTTTWTRRSHSNRGTDVRSVDLVERVSKRLSDDSAYDVSASLLYRIRHVLALLADTPRWEPGKAICLPTGLDCYRFVSAEVARAFAGENAVDPSRLEETAQLVWDILHISSNSTQTSDCSGSLVTVDGLLLARFLSKGGCEEDSQ